MITQSVFLLNHVLLLIGILGLPRSGATGNGALGRAGVRIAATGMVLLSVCEIGAMLLFVALGIALLRSVPPNGVSRRVGY